MITNAKCKICRRAGEKLFLKGEKCTSQKCPLLRKPYPPGLPSKRRRGRSSEYGLQLKEAQKLKKTYLIGDKQFKKIIKKVFKKRRKEDVSELLLRKLERRFANIVYRAGLAKSRDAARQLISHAHFLINGKKVNVPSYEVKIGDEIQLLEKTKDKNYFKDIMSLIKVENIPNWLSFNKEKRVIKVVREPKIEEIGLKTNLSLVLAFYSK